MLPLADTLFVAKRLFAPKSLLTAIEVAFDEMFCEPIKIVVPDKYKSFHAFVALPNEYVTLAAGIRLPVMLPVIPKLLV